MSYGRCCASTGYGNYIVGATRVNIYINIRKRDCIQIPILSTAIDGSSSNSKATTIISKGSITDIYIITISRNSVVVVARCCEVSYSTVVTVDDKPFTRCFPRSTASGYSLLGSHYIIDLAIIYNDVVTVNHHAERSIGRCPRVFIIAIYDELINITVGTGELDKICPRTVSWL